MTTPTPTPTSLIGFLDINGHQVQLPAASVSHWTLGRDGGLTVWAVNGPPLFPSDSRRVAQAIRVALGIDPDPDAVILPRKAKPAPAPPAAPAPGRKA